MDYVNRWALFFLYFVLLFSCLCIGFGGGETTTTTTLGGADTTIAGDVKPVEETTTIPEEEWGEEDFDSTTETSYELWPDTTFEIGDETTLPVKTTATTQKKKNGLSCRENSECASGQCIDLVCCNKGQCSFRNNCYDVGEARADGRLCQKDGSWKKPKGSICYTNGECMTGYCKDGVCCANNECGSAFVKACYGLGQISFDQTETCVKNDEGEAVWKKRDGQPCGSDSGCASSKCVDGVCVAVKKT